MATAKSRGRQATEKPPVTKPDGAKALKVVPRSTAFAALAVPSPARR